MRTFAEINNEQLLIEAIRRLRKIKMLVGGRKSPEGTAFEKIISALLESGLMSQKDMMQVLNNLLASGEVLITGYSRFCIPTQRLPIKRKRGVISKLHLDSKIAHWQYFTESGTPIMAKHRDGHLIYPNKNTSYWALKFIRIYVVSDGLPASTQALQKRGPAQSY